MRRFRTAAWLLAAMSSLAIAAPVFAVAPERSPWIAPDPFEFAAGEACTFPVRLEVTANGAYTLSYVDGNGNPDHAISIGRIFVRLTNVDDPSKSIEVNISGPGFTTFHDDGSQTFVLSGVSLPLEPGTLYVSRGPIVQEIDSDGNVTSTSLPQGTSKDICALID